MTLTPTEKCKKLLEYSVILKPAEKKIWMETLPKMDEKQIQTLYNVLVDEVRAWKKEGISIVPDFSLESQLMPGEAPHPAQAEHGASINSLKQKLGAAPSTPTATPSPPAPQPSPPQQPPSFKTFEPLKPAEAQNAAWMLSNKVVVPKNSAVVKPKPSSVPKVRNRVARFGLESLDKIKSVDDLSKIEPAHLRQGPLTEQIAAIKQVIGKIAAKNDLLPVNILPVFEKSPLFKTYLKAGAILLEKNLGEEKVTLEEIMGEVESAGMDALTQQEFEAVADLKKELESMAGL